ncbi:hypothetical protein XENOCAPTIV_002434, partial [Xenoophorus captivus]
TQEELRVREEDQQTITVEVELKRHDSEPTISVLQPSPENRPEVVVVEPDAASQVSGSGCTSQASVDDDDDVPVSDMYFVSGTQSHEKHPL